MTRHKQAARMVALPYELDELYVVRFWRSSPPAPARMAAFRKLSKAEEFARKRIEYGDAAALYSIEGDDMVAEACPLGDVASTCDNVANAESVDPS